MTSLILSNLLIYNDVGQVGQLFQSIAYTRGFTFLGALPEDLSHLSQMGGCVSMGPGGRGARSFALSEFFRHEKRKGVAQ